MRWIEILNEGPKRYRPMFGAYVQVCKAFDLGGEQQVETLILKAEEMLQREDRVIWYLRWARANLCSKYVETLEPESKPHQSMEHLFERALKELQVTADEFRREWPLITEQILKHFAKHPAQPLQAVVWNRELPSVLFKKLDETEKEWTKRQSQIIRHDDYGPEVFLDFGNGWAWYDLEQSSCDIEAKAMGHCGNAGGNYNDTILTLRKDMGDGKFRPSLTFILDENGYLGEMKGRENEKPKERYHSMIIPLLMDSRIKGINGGGYEAHRNFSLRDLPERTREQILKKKPELKELPELWEEYPKQPPSDPGQYLLWEKIGRRIEEGVKADVESRYDSMKGTKIDLKRGLMSCHIYKDIDDYLAMNFSYCSWTQKLFDEDLVQSVWDTLTREKWRAEEIVEAAKDDLFVSLFRRLLPYDHDYKVDSIADSGGLEMLVELDGYGKVGVWLPLDLYFRMFWGEDALENRRWLDEGLDEVENHRNNDMTDFGLIEDENDPLKKEIFRHLHKIEKLDKMTNGEREKIKTKPSQELVDLIIERYEGEAGEKHYVDPRQYEMTFEALRRLAGIRRR